MNRSSTTQREQQTEQQQQDRDSQEGASGCLLRVYWMVIGHALVAAMAYRIAQADGLLTAADLFFWLFVTSLIGVRYVDINRFGGRTAEGRPATMRHWQRYSLLVLGVDAIVWMVSHCVNYFVK